MIGKAEKLIKFKHQSDNIFVPPIVPASKTLPAWYKNLAYRYPEHGQMPWEAPTVKGCMPFFDALVQGYVIPLWADLFVTTKINEEGVPYPIFTWGERGDVLIESHEGIQTLDMPMMEQSLGGGPAFKFLSPWIIETPKGYSTLFVPPLNNAHPYFQVISAIVSTDSYKQFINFPFIWTGPEDYEGVLLKGTPIVQLLPFKRDDFRHDISTLTTVEETRIHAGSRALANSFQGIYKQLWRKTSQSR